ncbi:MAG: hypothetical protein JM58_14345 [Peptococcaceae bacterium BICA1-8]|nr:MAG: hypothetical protein JM58_14345 [Peptococcaceae bacterium BICA1-8]
MVEKGTLIITLDFELYWGNIDQKSLEEFKEISIGARLAVLSLLELFKKYNIHATWATVGFLFFETYKDLVEGLPEKKPEYLNPNLSPYNYLLDNLGENEEEDPSHYALSLIKQINTYANQEIASHTFSHYYCLEKGQNEDDLKDDLEAAIKVAQKANIKLKSLVFPRNQINKDYLFIYEQLGFSAYRGNARSWIRSRLQTWKSWFRYHNNGPRSLEDSKWSKILKAIRLIDDYFNIFGHNTYPTEEIINSFPFDIYSSRYLRPYSKKLKFLDWLKLHRIKADLTYAAKHKQVYHLWWHPYDFGTNLKENMLFLNKIIDHFLYLQKKYGMKSLNMGELADSFIKEE